jgi:hypothetical protein
MKDYGFVLRTAAAWIERMRGDADDADVAWMVAELRELESETLPQLISERDALKADKERLDWLSENSSVFASAIEIDHGAWLDDSKPNLREAIDAARSS